MPELEISCSSTNEVVEEHKVCARAEKQTFDPFGTPYVPQVARAEKQTFDAFGTPYVLQVARGGDFLLALNVYDLTQNIPIATQSWSTTAGLTTIVPSTGHCKHVPHLSIPHSLPPYLGEPWICIGPPSLAQPIDPVHEPNPRTDSMFARFHLHPLPTIK